jgi:hypothetical protein
VAWPICHVLSFVVLFIYTYTYTIYLLFTFEFLYSLFIKKQTAIFAKSINVKYWFKHLQYWRPKKQYFIKHSCHMHFYKYSIMLWRRVMSKAMEPTKIFFFETYFGLWTNHQWLTSSLTPLLLMFNCIFKNF